MIPADVEVYVGTEPVDMRRSFDILCGIIRERFDGDPRCGSLFVFFGKRRERLKILFYDKNGYCILYKRLDRGTFQLPHVVAPGATHVVIDPEELALLLEGLAIEKKEHQTKRIVH